MSEGGFLVRCEQVKATATGNTARGATESLRQAVTECKISDNDIPYMVDNSKFDPTYCVPLVPNSYSVTACRV